MLRKLAVLASLLALVGLAPPKVLADTVSLQSILFNASGTQRTDYTLAGLNSAGFNGTTGLGTLTFTDTGAGAHSFNVFFDHSLTAPFYNEYGAVSAAPPVAGQSWEIGDSFASTIYSDTQAGVLTNTNMLPGQTDNYLNTCSGPTCNGDVAMAMGFNYTLLAGQTETVTLTVSHTQPTSGFYLEEIHPLDAGAAPPPGNGSPVTIFLTGSAVTNTTTVIPEPSTWLLLSSGLLGLLFFWSRRRDLLQT